MKRWLGWILTSIPAFAVGCMLVFCVRASLEFFEHIDLTKVKTVPAVELAEIEMPILLLDTPPIFDPNANYTRSLKTKLLKTGEFHSEEVPYKSGEKWLGLFRIGDRYVLEPTEIRIRPIDDGGLMDTEVSTSNRNTSVFLLRGATSLTPGEIETAFDSERGDELNLLAKNSFGRRGQFWWLWVENAAPEGHLQKGSALLLQQSGFDPLVLRTIPEGCNDCGWRVLWVGDLDRDTNLDFLIDVSSHYNSYEPALFLSSKGYSVFASFWGVGC
ncbi:MAG: hypothetical protein IPM25_07605 [Chloracidobacterium sp.]|nr:hypothetical protein [Chloracidobacterium sp.]